METVLRDGLATDTLNPAGIYFGTRSGKVFGSNNDGNSWQMILEGLPSIVCVKAALVGDGRPAAKRGHKPAMKKTPAAKKAAKRTGR
jgi:hypothetical protein